MVESQSSAKIKFLLPAMDCPSCASRLVSSIQSKEGIVGADIDLVSSTITIHYHPELTDPQRLADLLAGEGYPPRIEPSEGRKLPAKLITTTLSGFLALTGTVLDFLGFPPYVLVPLLSAAILLGGYRIAYRGLRTLLSGRLDMNFLMTVAVLGAAIIGEWSEAAVVIFLFSLAELIEGYTMGRVRRAVQKLTELSPPMANLISDNSVVEVPVERVALGGEILIREGERIPLDGIILEGRSHVDQSTITGESIPVLKEADDEVFAGTMNGEGALTVRVTAGYRDTTLARIIHLVEEARSKRAKVHRFIDRFAAYYTPLVVASALMVAIIPPLLLGAGWLTWVYRALVLLVISCPCALVISTPVTIISALTAAARSGVLIKGGIHLEQIRKTAVVALDKTGTLTVGRLQVSAVISHNSFPEEELITIAASLEVGSEHHLARAIRTYSQRQGISPLPADSFKAIPGRGVVGVVEGRRYILGNHLMVEEWGWCDHKIHDELERQIAGHKTAVLLASSAGVVGIIAFNDRLRDEAKESIEELRRMGIRHLVMLTGDNAVTAEEFARQAQMDQVWSGLLPQAKAEVVQELGERIGAVMMVGDGVNDAPALVAADVGVAMGAVGSDAAIENADVALMGDDLRKLPALLRHSRKTMRIVVQNVVLALSIKAVFLALAVFGLATLWMAVFADMGASIVVIFNGMRCLRRI